MPLRDADDSVTAAHYARAADVYDSAPPFYSTAELNHETLLGLVVDGLALRAEHRCWWTSVLVTAPSRTLSSRVWAANGPRSSSQVRSS